MRLRRILRELFGVGTTYKSARRKYIIQQTAHPDGRGTYYRVILTDCIVPWSEEFVWMEKNFRTIREAREWVENQVKYDNNKIFD